MEVTWLERGTDGEHAWKECGGSLTDMVEAVDSLCKGEMAGKCPARNEREQL
ncbi:hypothetical protein [Paenibacillus agaridevorans]|uniref:hypothetical protein n=1 Tax=Paenibacillus agaridevorans TaxID=171404 RepID=UPI001BE4B460|nr:hypothetical protein [Paenibacillus agaridevorans]